MSASSLTYFLDRALGKSVGIALQAIGKKVEFHNDHFAPDSPDTEWLPIVSQRGWIVLTKDENIGRNILEVQAIADNKARVFILVSGNLSTQGMINIFVDAIEKIEKIVKGHSAPFIAKVYKDSRVTIWKNANTLRKFMS
jgi:predicted nuclease of predicted toxin-antitoxin system